MILRFERLQWTIAIAVFTHVISIVSSQRETPIYPCDASNSNNSFIFCSGRILEAVNMHNLYNDSKTFVDMPLKYDPAVVQASFDSTFGTLNTNQINTTQLQQFIDDNFLEAGHELSDCTPPDWQPFPPAIMAIQDPTLRQWALDLNAIWKHLCKQINASVAQETSRHSLIYVPGQFIAPGGRFREFYYWDAYWIIKGLLVSSMMETTRSMIRNLGVMVKKYGFVPNGGRVYYLKRSQPPMLTPMVYEYYEKTGDAEFVREMLPILELEFRFWMEQRSRTVTVNGKNYTVFQYLTCTTVPRPESFREDVQTAQKIADEDKPKFWQVKEKICSFDHKQNETIAEFNDVWQNVATAAESGWDFSSRWLKDKRLLYTIEITDILPVDLNAFMCWNMDLLEFLYDTPGNNMEMANHYREMESQHRRTMNDVFYNETTGAFHDYNLRTEMQNTDFYPSVAVPLFTGCYHPTDMIKAERLFQYMNVSGAFDFPGGVPSSLTRDTEEQWDFPNGWSPLNHMIIEGLRKSRNAHMQEMAFKLAEKWVFGNFRVFLATHHMWEKYNVIGNVPQPGAGGEYEVQDGFGWTNGVILDLLNTYNDRFTYPSSPTNSPPESTTMTMNTTTSPSITTSQTRRQMTSFAPSTYRANLVALAAAFIMR